MLTVVAIVTVRRETKFWNSLKGYEEERYRTKRGEGLGNGVSIATRHAYHEFTRDILSRIVKAEISAARLRYGRVESVGELRASESQPQDLEW